MPQNVFYTILVIWVVGFLWGCTRSPAREGSLIFKDPQSEKRVSYLRHHLRINPNDVESRIELGRIFLSEHMIKEAINEFEKVLCTDSERIEALLLLSLAFQKLPKPNLTKAVMLLKKACQIEPDNADAHLNLAHAYSKLKDENKAINEFNKAIELSNDPTTLVSAHLGLMAIYKKRGEFEKANEEYERAYDIDPRVEEMIKQAEIRRMTHIEYADQEFEDELHPPLEKRVKKLQEEIRKMSEEE